MMKQMMTVICSATLAACGSAPVVQPQSEYQVMTISTNRQRTADNLFRSHPRTAGH